MSLKKYVSNVPRGKYFWFLMLNVAVTGLASTMLGPFLPVFLYKQLGISVGAVSFLYFANGLAGTLTVLFMGWLVDRVGRKKVYAFGNSSAAIIPAAWAATTTLSQAFPIITISGVMDSASRTSQTTIIADQVEESKRNTAYGVSRIVANVAWIFAPLIGGAILAGQGNFLPLFVVSGFIGLLGLLAFIGLVPESRKVGLVRPKLPNVGVLRDRDLLVLCVASLFTMLFYTQFYSLLPIFATQVKGLNSLQVGALFSISGVTVVALQFPTSSWLERIPKQTGYILGVVILAIGITGLALAPSFYWLLLAVVVMTLGENMFFPIAQTLVTEIAPEAERGMYVGAFSLFLNIGGNVSPLLGGTIWQLTGNAYLPWLLSPVYAGISVALAILFKLKRPRKLVRTVTGLDNK
jgi:MFS family permease